MINNSQIMKLKIIIVRLGEYPKIFVFFMQPFEKVINAGKRAIYVTKVNIV